LDLSKQTKKISGQPSAVVSVMTVLNDRKFHHGIKSD
jgi:hypothetical protein